jgi:hypothetical protein
MTVKTVGNRTSCAQRNQSGCGAIAATGSVDGESFNVGSGEKVFVASGVSPVGLIDGVYFGSADSAGSGSRLIIRARIRLPCSWSKPSVL